LLYSVTNSGRLFLTKNTIPGAFLKIAFGADNNQMVSEYFSGCKDDNFFLCTTSGIIKLWGISNGTKSSISLNQEPNPIGLNGQMLDAIAVSPDGSTIAAASCNPVNNDITKCEKEDITLWDFKSRQRSDKSFSLSDLTISNEKSVDLAYSPDGKMLAISINTSNIFNANSSTRPLIVLWNVLTNHKIGLFEVTDGVQQMTFSPDSKTLAIASSSLILVDVASVNDVTPPHQEKIGSAPIWSLAYSPDGKMLAVGNNDKTISLLDTTKLAKIGQSLTLPSSLDQDPNSISVSMAFSPDGKILASGHKFGLVVLWDVASQTKLAGPLYNHVDPLQKNNYPVFSVTFSPDGKFLATASTQIILWDMNKTSWIAKACKLAGRDFTQGEWQLTFGDQPYKPVCGG
jgi:WD40 repeat protein